VREERAHFERFKKSVDEAFNEEAKKRSTKTAKAVAHKSELDDQIKLGI
jgi:hypothetical protein